MSQFRPFLPFQQIDEVDVIEVGGLEEPRITTEPLGILADHVDVVEVGGLEEPKVTTEPLGTLAEKLPGITATVSLSAALQTTVSSKAAKRIVFIPGRPGVKTTTAPRKMSFRLRQGLVLASLLLVVIVSLLSLSPLANGQYGFPIFRGISNWIQMQQLMWQLQGHGQAQANLPPPPSVKLPASQYVAIAERDAIAAGIPPAYFVRQINQESLFNPNAVSPAGAIGIAQFMPNTAATMGVNPWDPIQALAGAARLMASYVSQYGGNYAMALAAYNAGTGAVLWAVNNCGANWMNCLPAETRNYIWVIMGI